MAMNQIAVSAPSAAVPASRPSTIAKREIGAEEAVRKPISMSWASAIPPLLPVSIVAWIIAPASMKSRKPLTSGNSGSSTALPAPPTWIASSSVGSTRIGAISCGRRKVCLTDRPQALRSRGGWR